jgi:cytochrome P450
VIDLDAQRSDDVSFGAGVHYCPGASLARLEGRIAVRALLTLPAVVRDGAESWFPGRTIRRLTALPVRVTATDG